MTNLVPSSISGDLLSATRDYSECASEPTHWVPVLFIMYSYVQKECIIYVSDRRSVWPQALSCHGKLCGWALGYMLIGNPHIYFDLMWSPLLLGSCLISYANKTKKKDF